MIICCLYRSNFLVDWLIWWRRSRSSRFSSFFHLFRACRCVILLDFLGLLSLRGHDQMSSDRMICCGSVGGCLAISHSSSGWSEVAYDGECCASGVDRHPRSCSRRRCDILRSASSLTSLAASRAALSSLFRSFDHDWWALTPGFRRRPNSFFAISFSRWQGAF